MRCRVVTMVLVVALVGCSGSDDATDVAAASSLTEVVSLIDAEVPLSVDLNGSSILAEQLLDGLDVDVFLSADAVSMQRVVDAGLLSGEPLVFAQNHLVVAVPAGNPGDVSGLGDLGTAGLDVGLCDPSVPCGALAALELAAAGVSPSPDTEEPNVRSLLAKLRAGELDVALVYATDALAAVGEVEVVADLSMTTEYFAGILLGGDTAAGRDLVEYLRSAAGVAVLTDLGFDTP